MKKILLLLTTIPLFHFSFAHAEWVRYENYKVQLAIPKPWKIVTDLYGMPITVLGPERGGERAVLSIQHTPLKNISFDYSEIKSTQNDYFEGRKAWIQKQNSAKFISPIPYHKLVGTVGSKLDGFEIGYRYQIMGHQFEERSAQINCGGRLYLLKTLTSEKNTKEDRSTLDRLVNQFQCANVTVADGKYVPGPLHAIQDLIREDNTKAWPSSKDFKNASAKQKVQALKALIEFYKDYESAADDTHSGNASAPSQSSRAFAFLKSQLLILFPTANADEDYNCFFGGWPSVFTKQADGRTSCEYPAKVNNEYSQSQCGATQLACNPALFGDNVCIDVSTADLRAHATMECDQKFQAAGGKYEDVVNSPNFNSALLQQSMDSAKKVCATDNYVSSNYGLCHTLEEKLAASAGKRTDSASDPGFIQNLDAIKEPDFDNSLKAITEEWQNFQTNCLDDQGNFKATVDGCPDALTQVKADMDRIEKTDQQAPQELAADSGTLPTNANCHGCGIPTSANDTTAGPADSGGSCSADEKKKIQDETCKWGSGDFWRNTGDCLGNLTTSLLSDVWGNITALPELAWAGVKAGAHQVGDLFHKMFGTEDQSSNKALTASGTSDSLLRRFMHDPKAAALSTLSSIGPAIMSSIVTYLQDDVFCQSWSGTPHFSKCVLKGNFGCLSCLTKVKAGCSIAGVVIGEAAPWILTEGGIGYVEAGKALAEAGKEGKLAEAVIDAEKAVPELESAEKAAKAAKVGKDANLVEKTTEATTAAEKVSKIKTAWKSIKDFKAAFHSKLGDWDETLEKLAKSKNDSKLVRYSAKTVGNVYKGSKALTSGAQYVASLPAKPYEYAGELGFKIGAKLRNRAFVNAIKATAEVSAVTTTAATAEAVKDADAIADAARAERDAKDAAAATSKLPSGFKLPEVQGIEVRKAKYVDNFKTYESYQFDSSEKEAEAKKLIQEHNELMQKAFPETATGTKPTTAAEHLQSLKDARASQAQFAKLDKNEKKMQALISEDMKAQSNPAKNKLGEKFKMPDAKPAMSSYRAQVILHLKRTRILTLAGVTGEDISSMNTYGLTKAQLKASAQSKGMTVAALQAQILKNKGVSSLQTKLLGELTAGQTPSADELAQAQTDGISMDALQQQANNQISDNLFTKVSAGQTLTQKDQDQMKALGITLADIQAKESLSAPSTDDSSGESPQ